MPLEPSEYTEGPTDFHSLMTAPDPVLEAQRKKPVEKTDFRSLVGENYGQVKFTQQRSANDLIIDALSPIMVFFMVYAVMYFLLDVRYVVTAVHDQNLRFVMFAFLMGVVALNRLVARDGSAESVLYIIGLGGAVSLYTLSAQVYDVGSFAGPWLHLTPEMATVLNLIIVAFLWWLVNRLTHECCVDENRVAGDIGILTGTALGFKKMLANATDPAPQPKVKRKRPDILEPWYVIEAYDPTEGYQKKAQQQAAVLTATQKLPKRHPGMSIFYFSVPVMLLFALGLRMVQHGGPRWILAGQFYMGVYTFCALMLLLLTSLGQLREYFRMRKIAIPDGLGWFWLGLGLVMTGIVMVGASRLPMPPLPPLAHVEEHIADPWDRNAAPFMLLVDSRGAADLMAESRAMDRIGDVILGVLGLFLVYGALKGLGALAGELARKNHLPRVIVRFLRALERLVDLLTTVPKFPERRERVRVQKEIATSRRYSNSMGDRELAARMTVNDHVEYAYQALCALAYDLGVPRAIDQTPYEFIETFPKELKGLKDEAMELTRLYVVAAYSPLEMDEKVTDRLRKFWQSYNRIRNRIVR